MKGSWWIVCLALALTQVAVRCHEEEMDVKKFQEDLKVALGKAKEEVKEERIEDRDKKRQGIDTLNNGTADDQLNLFAAAEDESIELAKSAIIQLKTFKKLISAEHIDPFRIKVSRKFLNIWKKKFGRYCPGQYMGPPCKEDNIYRTEDGSCNNFQNPSWGAKHCPQLREIPPMYNDGVDEPRQRDKWGLPLPGARTISNTVYNKKGKSPRNAKLTVMVMQWGQFIDHEFVATPVMKGEMGANIQCCGDENKDRSQCFPIMIADDDPYFNKTCMNFVRSAPAPNHACNPGFREQMNQVTSYIDGSAVYGSSKDDMDALRTFSGGLLKTEDNTLLPKNKPDKCVLLEPKDYCQKAGDARVNVVPSLGMSHTTFVREHQRIAKELAAINPHWDDETIFQETRRVIWASIQHINYAEYLPAIFNGDIMKKYRLKVTKKAFSRVYSRRINPSISNVFAVAAFRFGHSQIPDYQATMTKNYKFSEKRDIELTYHKPHMITTEGGKALDGIARWLVSDPTPLADGLFEDGTRNKLFMDKEGNSLDLPALNIQRGRDHGIPGYNHWRIHCKLDKAEMGENDTFILPDHTEEEVHKLEHAYRHVDDIDLFAGAMTETLLPDSSVGPTFACLLGKQFQRLKRGDRFWYETPNKAIRFTSRQLREIKMNSLAKVLCNCYDISTIQPDVFKVPGPGNERVECSAITGIDLSKWKACEESRRYQDRPDFNPKYCKKRKSKGGN